MTGRKEQGSHRANGVWPAPPRSSADLHPEDRGLHKARLHRRRRGSALPPANGRLVPSSTDAPLRALRPARSLTPRSWPAPACPAASGSAAKVCRGRACAPSPARRPHAHGTVIARFGTRPSRQRPSRPSAPGEGPPPWHPASP